MALTLGLLAGCQSPSGIAINRTQTLVMDSPVLTAGILADNPDISAFADGRQAQSRVTNSQDKPVVLQYQFYWYDSKGLEIEPIEAPRRVTLAGNSSFDLSSITANRDARLVRLYLYL